MDLDLLHERLLGSLLRLGGGHGEEFVLGSNVVDLGQLFGVLLSLLLLSSKLSLERGVRLLRALDRALDHALDVLARASNHAAALRLQLDPRVGRLLSQRRDFRLRLFQSHQEDHVVRGELGDALLVPRRGRLRLLRAFQSLREVGPGVVSLLQPSLVPVHVAPLLLQNFDSRERRHAAPDLASLAVISATSFSRAVLRKRFVVSSAYPAVDASCSVTVPADVSERCSAAASAAECLRSSSKPAAKPLNVERASRSFREARLAFLRRVVPDTPGAEELPTAAAPKPGVPRLGSGSTMERAHSSSATLTPSHAPAILSQSAVTAWDCAADGAAWRVTTLALTTLAGSRPAWRSARSAEARSRMDLRPSSRRRSSSAFLEAAAPAAVARTGLASADGCTRRAMPLIGEAPADEGADPGRAAIAPPARVDVRATPPVAVVGRGGAPRLSTSPSATYAAMVFLGDRFIIATSGCANPAAAARAWMWRALEGAPARLTKMSRVPR